VVKYLLQDGLEIGMSAGTHSNPQRFSRAGHRTVYDYGRKSTSVILQGRCSYGTGPYCAKPYHPHP